MLTISRSLPSWAAAAVLAGMLCATERPDQIKDRYFQLSDVFQLEYASDPQISPDGERIVYVRNFVDVMTDRQRSNLWTVNSDGSRHRPLTTGNQNDSAPRWSPNGTRVLFVSTSDGSAQLYLRWVASGETAKLTNLTSSPSGIAWSPDGRWIAFSMLVPEKAEPAPKLPAKPEGAEWAEPLKVVRKLTYRSDGQGYLKDGYFQLFVLPADGGTPRQLTSGDFHHRGTPAWTPDGRALLFSANRHEGWEYDPRNSEIYEVSLSDRRIKALTDRQGPDTSPSVSPDGEKIAYVGYDDRYQGYQVRQLYLMNRDGSGSRLLTAGLDRSVVDPVWSGDGKGVFFRYDDQGNSKVGYVTTEGQVRALADRLGGTFLELPYTSGSFSLAKTGSFAYTWSDAHHPAEVAVGDLPSEAAKRVTRLNDDLLGHKKLGEVEEIWYKSSHDGRRVQGWIVKPPEFDPGKKYPLILEIHGGPFHNYGERFGTEVQLYAAAGYVVLYTNPRGSTSYGEEFGNLIHHSYPGNDYDDLMSGVDAVLAKGYIDPDNLFITGGSGGGVLTSWSIGKTDRFRAAVVGKPVINWYSFALTSDMYNFFYKYWFPGLPWEHTEHYMRRSPISLVGNVKTPTMVLTGEADHRTPIAESEQYYQALKLRKVEAVLVRVPGASHHYTRRPSHQIAKVAHTLKWFDTHRTKSDQEQE